jgi:hypothetical protein
MLVYQVPENGKAGRVGFVARAIDVNPLVPVDARAPRYSAPLLRVQWLGDRIGRCRLEL